MPPSPLKKAIPYSLSMRIVRICSDPNNRDITLQELRDRLIERGYSGLLIDSAVERARKIPRSVALRKVENQKQKKGPIFAHTYDPRLPSVAQIQAKHWRSMVQRNNY